MKIFLIMALTLFMSGCANAPDYIYALYWGFRYADSRQSKPTIIKLDWDGNIIARYSDLTGPLYRIAAKDDSTLIGWTGHEFVFLIL